MSAGQFSGLLLHTAVVYRRMEGPPGIPKKDRLGQPTRDEESHHSMPCRITRASGGVVMAERSRDVVSVTHSLFLDRGADLRETDVVSVLGEAGQIIVDRSRVLLVNPVYDGVRIHHIEAKLNAQREAT